MQSIIPVDSREKNTLIPSLPIGWMIFSGFLFLFVFLAPPLFAQEEGGGNNGGDSNANGGDQEAGLIYEEERFYFEETDEVTIVYQVGNDRASTLENILNHFDNIDPRVQYLNGMEKIMVTDTRENISQIEKIINIMDSPSPQIQIRAVIVETLVTDEVQLGFEGNWMNQGSGIGKQRARSFNQDFRPTDLIDLGEDLFQGSTISYSETPDPRGTEWQFDLHAVQDREDSEIISRPFIKVNSGETANISSGTKVPIPDLEFDAAGFTRASVNLRDVDISLEVTPSIVGENFVHMHLNPNVDGVLQTVDIQGVPTPIISSRGTNTYVTVRSGDRVYIGGMFRTEATEQMRGIPLLMDMPGLGYLFRRTEWLNETTQLYFIIEPEIIDGPSADTGIPRIIEPESSGSGDRNIPEEEFFPPDEESNQQNNENE